MEKSIMKIVEFCKAGGEDINNRFVDFSFILLEGY